MTPFLWKSVMCLLCSWENAASGNLLMEEIAEAGMPCLVDASIALTAMGDKPLLSVSNENKSTLSLGNGTPVWFWLIFGKVNPLSQFT